MGMKIGSVAEAAGWKSRRCGFTSGGGLLADPPRTESGCRPCDDSVIDRIRFVRQAQDLGFTLEEIEELLDLRVGRVRGEAPRCPRLRRLPRQ